MPSADFCHAIRDDRSSLSGSVHTWQTSRGKAQSFHDVNARFIKYTPVAEGGLRGPVAQPTQYQREAFPDEEGDEIPEESAEPCLATSTHQPTVRSLIDYYE